MSRIVELSDSIASFLKEQKADTADKANVNADYFPAKITRPGTIYIDVMPAVYRGETVENRRLRVRHEDNAIRILVRSKMPEKFTKEDIDALIDSVERTSDLLLNASWGDDTECSSVETTYDEIAKGLFSSTIVAHIKTRWDCQG